MAKKVVASLQTGKNFAKIIRFIKSKKTNAYIIKETIIPINKIKEFLFENEN